MDIGSSFFAHVLGCDRGVDSVPGQRDGEVQVGVREPVAAEISGVDHAGDSLPVGGGLRLKIFDLSLSNQAMNGNYASAWTACWGNLPAERGCGRATA